MEPELSDRSQRLVDCLTEQKSLYFRIVEVLTSEKNYLILADIQSLVENNKLKEALLSKSRALEKIRQLKTDDLLKALSLDSKKSISDIVPLLPKDKAKALIQIQSELAIVIQDLKKVNLQNEKLVQNAKSAIETGLKSMKGESPETQIYKKQGTLEGGRASGKIVSKEI